MAILELNKDELKIDATVVFEKTLEAISETIPNPNYGIIGELSYNQPRIPRYRFIEHRGGARSSKTWSISQIIIYKCITEWENKTITVARKTLPALKFSAMKDFFRALELMNIYQKKYHNKSECTYRIGTNEICFTSIDDPQKVKGRQHNVVWLNEANELELEDFTQVNMRTEDFIFLDYNPSDEDHWIYDKVSNRAETTMIHSTYKDNTFLKQSIVNEIERFKEEDFHYWTIYGLGEKATSPVKIYHNYKVIDKSLFPEPDEIIYGLDFNYDPQTLLEIRIRDGHYYLTELFYENKLITKDIIEKMELLIPNKQREVYCDSAEPDRIEEIERAGFNVHKAVKDVEAGIMFCKGLKLYVNAESVNLQDEFKKYSWKVDKNGKIIKVPVKANDHFMDEMRYALYTHHKRGYIRNTVTIEDLKRMQNEWQQAREGVA